MPISKFVYLCLMLAPLKNGVHNKKTRSYNMSQIKGKNTKPEMLVRKFLHTRGLRYKLHDKKLPGKPDLVLPKYETVANYNSFKPHDFK